MKSSAVAKSPSEDDWRAEDDHRTMMRAGEISADKARMAGVKRHHKKQTKALAKVGGMLGKR